MLAATLSAYSRRHVLDDAVRPMVVLVLAPIVDGAVHVAQAGEAVQGPALVAARPAPLDPSKSAGAD